MTAREKAVDILGEDLLRDLEEAGLTVVDVARGSGSVVRYERLSARAAGHLTPSDLAVFCGVDIKTIHNWVDKGDLVGWRTPGRHLRFGRDETRAFLERFGYPIPAELADARGAA